MKLNTKRTVLIGLAFMSISAFWQLYDFLIPLILTNTFGVSDTIAGFVMSLDNILALFMLPFFGALSDKVDTKYGKRMPFIVIGTFVAVVSLIIIPFAANEKILWLFVIGLLVVLIAMSTYRSPAVALMPDVTPKPMRSKGNAIINLMGAVGGMIALLMLNFLSPQKFSGNQYPIFIGIALFMAVSIFIMILFVRENRWRKEMESISEHVHAEEELVTESGEMKADVKSSLTYILISISLWFMGYNAVISAFSRYAVNELHLLESQASNILLVANISAIICFIPIGILGTKMGRKKTIQLGILSLLTAFATTFFYRDGFSPLMYVNFALAGFGWAAINVNSLPMVLEMTTGGDVGKYTGLYYTFSMSAQIITPILSGFLFDVIGYHVLFPYASFFVLASLLTMTRVKHGDAKLSSYHIDEA